MVGDGYCDPVINNHCHYLLYHLHEAYSVVVSSPLGIRTTVYHMDYSASRPSPKSSLTRANTFSQFISSLTYISPSPPPSFPPLVLWSPSSPTPTSSPPTNHPLICSYCIPEGNPEQLLRSLWTAQSISSSLGTKSSTWNDLTDRGILSPGGCMW